MHLSRNWFIIYKIGYMVTVLRVNFDEYQLMFCKGRMKILGLQTSMSECVILDVKLKWSKYGLKYRNKSKIHNLTNFYWNESDIKKLLNWIWRLNFLNMILYCVGFGQFNYKANRCKFELIWYREIL